MTRNSFVRNLSVASLPVLLAAATLAVRGLRADNSTPVTITVTATSRGDKPPAPIPQNEVQVREADSLRRIISWEPVEQSGSDLEIAILLDNSLSQRVDNDLNDLRAFVNQLPAHAQVAVAYAENGGIQYRERFTTDHTRAAASFRIPDEIPGTANGFYDSVRDLVEHWPADDTRHVLLVVSSGIDLTNGVSETEPYLNLPLGRAIEAAERAGVVVYGIYASPNTPLLSRNAYLTNNGEGSLGRLTAETGGEAFFQGFSTPVSMLPFLTEIQHMLAQQYRLTFLADTSLGNSLLKVSTEQSGVKLHAPEHAPVPLSK